MRESAKLLIREGFAMSIFPRTLQEGQVGDLSYSLCENSGADRSRWSRFF